MRSSRSYSTRQALDPDQEKAVSRQFSRQYHLITRQERLEEIADDLVDHFVNRGFRGKAMYVAIDKATAVRMYDLVSERWAAKLADLEEELERTPVLERPHPRVGDRLHADHRQGSGRVTSPERNRRHGRSRSRHRPAPPAHRQRGPRHEVQGPR